MLYQPKTEADKMVYKFKPILLHALCEDCKWLQTDIKGGPKAAYNHAKDNNHKVSILTIVEAGYDGRKTTKPQDN